MRYTNTRITSHHGYTPPAGRQSQESALPYYLLIVTRKLNILAGVIQTISHIAGHGKVDRCHRFGGIYLRVAMVRLCADYL